MKKETKKRYVKPDSIRRFEEWERQARVAQMPDVPSSYVARLSFRDDTANGLTHCIIEFVKLHGGQAERISTEGRVIMERYKALVGGKVVDKFKPRRIPTNGCKGSADISATIDGRSVKIEVKIGRDRQSDAQKEYQRNIETAGGVYYIARDFTSFVDWYERTFDRVAFPNNVKTV